MIKDNRLIPQIAPDFEGGENVNIGERRQKRCRDGGVLHGRTSAWTGISGRDFCDCDEAMSTVYCTQFLFSDFFLFLN